MYCLPTQIPAIIVIVRKLGLQVFLPKNPFSTTKHPTNIKKLTYQPIKPKKGSKPPNQTEKKLHP